MLQPEDSCCIELEYLHALGQVGMASDSSARDSNAVLIIPAVQFDSEVAARILLGTAMARSPKLHFREARCKFAGLDRDPDAFPWRTLERDTRGDQANCWELRGRVAQCSTRGHDRENCGDDRHPHDCISLPRYLDICGNEILKPAW